MRSFVIVLSMLVLTLTGMSQQVRTVPIAEGWAGNSVNVTVFRKNSLASYGKWQFAAYYDQQGYVMLARRKSKSDKWTIHRTQHMGRVGDAHNVISIIVDGYGYLHVSWDHHCNQLRYAVSREPLSLELGEQQPMTGLLETNVTYPEFYRRPDGGLIFMYRSGGSGNGNLVMNRYDTSSKSWKQIQNNLVDGENQRNAYWQACVDNQGVIHVSWVWRDSPDVESNHDMCYAKSADGGDTWTDSKGNKYKLPINSASAEYVIRIPQRSELINQTSMSCDSEGRPYIATYWRSGDSEVPQYHVVYLDGRGVWQDMNLGFRTAAFSLSGKGTKRIPISRPQILADNHGANLRLRLLFRDEERGSRVSLATCSDLSSGRWEIRDLTDYSVGSWEPSYDTELWRTRNKLHVFVQNVEQIDGEGRAEVEPSMVKILEIK